MMNLMETINVKQVFFFIYGGLQFSSSKFSK